MKISTTVKPSGKKIAPSVSQSDIFKAGRQLAKEHGVDVATGLMWARQCFEDWKVVKEAAEEEARAKFFVQRKRAKKAGVVGAVVVDRTGGRFGGDVVDMESSKSRKEWRERREQVA